MITENELDLRVCGGIAYLDANRPEWRALINWRELDMQIPALCILGQLSRQAGGTGYFSYLRSLSDDVANAEEWARDNGFWLSPEDVGMDTDGDDYAARGEAFRTGYAMLQRAWMSQAC